MKSIKAFFIGVIGEKDSICRRYSDSILALCRIAAKELETSGYSIVIDRHDSKSEQLISKSIVENIISADLFFVLADYPFWNPAGDNKISDYNPANEVYWGFNPNVWFEYGLAATTSKSVIMLKYSQENIPFNSKEIHAINIDNDTINLLLTNLPKVGYNSQFSDVYSAIEELYNDKLSTIVQVIGNIQREMIARIKDHAIPFQYIMLEGAAKHLGFKNILDLLRSVSGVQFIDGEDESFKALIEDVKFAKSSIYSTRFANQSIVNSSNSIHSDFMAQLLEFSKKSGTVSERIICNNSVTKWLDIHKAMSNLIRVFVRGNDYSAHFELVIIDEETTFIHFYDKSMNSSTKKEEPKTEKNTYDDSYKIERINSTLRISANSDVCKKLLGVFQRHYRKPSNDGGQVYSQTILGVTDDVDYEKDDNAIGCFYLDSQIPESKRSNAAVKILMKKYLEMLNKYNESLMTKSTIKALTAKDIWRMYFGIRSVAEDTSFPIVESSFLPPQGKCPEEVEKEALELGGCIASIDV